MRIIFMGTPEFAVATLSRLVEGGYDVVCVVTQPDKPVGRHGSVLQAPPVKQYALEHGIPVLQPEKMRDPEFLDQLRSYHADLQVVVAFRMLPEVVWAMPPYGTFNVHASLLPQYRGAAPINWAIINGETQTGVTTFFLDHEIDTGRIILQRPFAIPDDADVEYVYDGLMHLGAQAAIDTIQLIQKHDGNPPTISQDNYALRITHYALSSAPKIFKDTCKIDWSQPAKRVYDFIRGLSPYPGAWCSEHGGLKIYKTQKTPRPSDGAPGEWSVDGKHLYINCQDLQLELLELQQNGKRRMQARDFINGMRG
ncbi:MAG: methionyl-tRNA formyltransferase [Prevotella sp.]|nr:methionyl-tRNA formyltransferase [Prevotella sp.]